MTVYIDGVLFLNFAFDFILLLTTSIVLKRNTKIFNLVLGAFIGSLSTLILFINVNSIQLFIIKIYLSILMNLFSFYYKDIKYTLTNITTFYIVSILLGGFLYMLNIEFSYKHEGIIFYNNGLSINVIILFIISPIILYIYVKQSKMFQKKIKNYHKVNIKIGKKELSLNGFLDTGNTLTYKGKPVIITNIKNTFRKKKIFVPYAVINGAGLLECIETQIYIPDMGTYDVLLGFSDNLNISGVDVLLNGKMEENNVTKNKRNIQIDI
ncbi:MAG: hypothetical protein HFH45_05070 [Bacilli bacterium]|nr:hypothetical protein [Bacilli bacterium]